MLDSLKFVQGAVGKKDFIPALTHYRIKDGFVTSFNGNVAISTRIDCDLDCIPQADHFYKAISMCEDAVSLHMTDAGRLAIQSGKFRAYVPCITDLVHTPEPEGNFPVTFNGEHVLKALQVLYPFIGDDASRPWSNGVLFKGKCAYATNNVMMVQHYNDSDFNSFTLPRDTIKEILRIGIPPVGMQSNDTSATFHYEDGSWVRSSLFVSQWPDVDKMLDQAFDGVVFGGDIDLELFEALNKVKPLAEELGGRIWFDEQGVHTSADPELGAHFEFKCDVTGCYNVNMMLLLEDVATKADFTCHPLPSKFLGDNLRGLIVGMR